MTCEIDKITLERYASTFGIGHDKPRISWRFKGDARDWVQQSYRIRIVRNGQEESYNVDSSQSTYVSWPSRPIRPRERLELSVLAVSEAGVSTGWKTLQVERGLSTSDWSAQVSLGPKLDDLSLTKRPFLLRRKFHLECTDNARLYITALGLYEATLNGQRIGDYLLAPGWQSYSHRLHYQSHDISAHARIGDNVLEVWVGEGWYAGRLGWAGGNRNMYGEEIGLIAQLEVDGVEVVRTGEEGWEWSYGALLSSELYDGESVDLNLRNEDWKPARSIARPETLLVAPESPPIRATEVIKPVEIIKTPSGTTIIDFGQNFVGWVRMNRLPSNATITLRHAEVLEHGELGTRPLRVCKATDTIITPRTDKRGLVDVSWEPKFTFHGFRYVQVDGYGQINLEDIEGVVVHSDMERLGEFECSHEWMTKFHRNTVWGLRGNFVSIPTDCPQRDERMGWTGDLQVRCTPGDIGFC